MGSQLCKEMSDFYETERAEQDLYRRQEIWDIAHGIRPGPTATCEQCGRTKLYWKSEDNDLKLYDGRTGYEHRCPTTKR